MDKDLEELKVKAQQMLKKCREGDLSVENLPDVRKSLNNLLNDIKSHKLLEDVEFMKIAKELGNEVVNFINTDLAELQKSAEEKISAAVDERELQDAKVFYLGKKGKLTAILKNMKDVPADQRPVIGTAANTVRAAVESFIGEKQAQLKAKRLESQIKNETVDITLPARHHKAGHVHPLDKALRKIMESFVRMGYSVEEGPEIESDYYCALKARNRYGRDECADLREIAAGLLPLDKQIQIEKNVFENYPMLVRDRVELSEEYLAVIDEVERLLEEECGENAHPLETAQAKARLLSERGILWRSEMQLNPGVLFD